MSDNPEPIFACLLDGEGGGAFVDWSQVEAEAVTAGVVRFLVSDDPGSPPSQC